MNLQNRLPSIHLLIAVMVTFSILLAGSWAITESVEPDYKQQAIEGCNDYFGKGNWRFINVTEEIENTNTWICKGLKSGEYYKPALVVPL